MPPKCPALYLAVLISASSFVGSRPAVAEDGMQWQFYEANDPDNHGAMTARLVYGVPETDNVQVMGTCDARPSTGVRFSSVTFGADIGDLTNGADADLRFSGGGTEQTLHGNIERAEGEGLSGVHIDIKNDDPIWTVFSEKDTLDYQVPGYRAATLKLTPGHDKLKAFVEACRSYEKEVAGEDKVADQANTNSAEANGNPEKEAFDSAKELGTAAAFEAFLSNYSSGFYADLARAYVKKLNKAAVPSPAAAPPAPPPPAPTPAAIPAPGPDPSCKDLFKVKSLNSATPAKITFINKSGMYRSIMWLDFKGRPKDYANLNSGQEVTLDTFLTHPWMVTDGPGNCVEIVMPHAGTRVVTLTGPHVAPPPPAKKASPPPAPKKKAAGPKCRSRSVLIDGKCILKRSAGDYCGPGYHLKHGKCVHGAYVTPRSKRSVHGCPPGLDWNPQEGCHEND